MAASFATSSAQTATFPNQAISSFAAKFRPAVRSRAELAERAKRITESELVRYRRRTRRSQALNERARSSLPAGVASSFQYYAPHPVMAERASGGHLWDVDGNEYVDFNMGYGALFSGHSHPVLAAALHAQIDRGTLFVTPCETNAEAAELIKERFGLDLVRFTNSGTEATHDAIRLARGFTGRTRIVKVEGGYHGHHDEVMVSMKPSIEAAGPAAAPKSVPATLGIPEALLAEVSVVAFNDVEALEQVLANGDVAAFIVEPCMQNIGICLPIDGYLRTVRRLTEKYGTVLIFDEVKTGITAGWGGATGHYGVQPDLITLAKSIGGGLPIGAFGGRSDIMGLITNGDVLHLGTFNGNPLCSAAVVAVLRDICTKDAIANVVAENDAMVSSIDEVIKRHSLPAHTVKLGAKGCVTYTDAPIRNYRDYLATDFDLAYANWIWSSNRGLLLPPGLDDQWLISVLHTKADIDRHVEVFEEFAEALTA